MDQGIVSRFQSMVIPTAVLAPEGTSPTLLIFCSISWTRTIKISTSSLGQQSISKGKFCSNSIHQGKKTSQFMSHD
jgi:hypothetical protein